MTYFSDRELGERPRNQEVIESDVWTALEFMIKKRIDDGSFGIDFPSQCPDGRGPCGTNQIAFRAVMHAEVPNFPEEVWKGTWGYPPNTIEILDVLEFCCRHVAEPSQGTYHSFFDHHHLSCDREAGSRNLLKKLIGYSVGNGLVYKLTEEGNIERIVAPVLGEDLASAQFVTGDSELDSILESARRKFLNPRAEIQREALLELWDAWERLKTIGAGSNKSDQISSLLDDAAGSAYPKFRERLETDAKELTSIGNTHQIRHTEITQEKVERREHIDYLFHRLFSMIQLILKTKGT